MKRNLITIIVFASIAVQALQIGDLEDTTPVSTVRNETAGNVGLLSAKATTNLVNATLDIALDNATATSLLSLGGNVRQTVDDDGRAWIEVVTNSSSVYVVSTSGVGYNGPSAGTGSTGYDPWTIGAWTLQTLDNHPLTGEEWTLRNGDFSIQWQNTDNPGATLPVSLQPQIGATGSLVIDWIPITNRFELAKQEPTVMMISEHNAASDAHKDQFGLGTNWVVRAGLAGSVSFVNNSDRPQAWSGAGALTISSLTALRPPEPVYWTLQGFSSVTFPAGTYFIGGGSWQADMVNHFVVWKAGDEVLVNFITATEI